jgi:hypothetical protein
MESFMHRGYQKCIRLAKKSKGRFREEPALFAFDRGRALAAFAVPADAAAIDDGEGGVAVLALAATSSRGRFGQIFEDVREALPCLPEDSHDSHG